MGGNSIPKKRGLVHHLHKQWLGTKQGKEQHQAEIERQRRIPAKPIKVK
jgi:hypothetical protein